MGELIPNELTILRPESRKPVKIGEMRRRLMRELNATKGDIGHCIDGEKHEEMGHNEKFIVMIENNRPRTQLLVAITPEGSQNVVPHSYIGSIPHPQKANTFVHFYFKIKPRQTPIP